MANKIDQPIYDIEDKVSFVLDTQKLFDNKMLVPTSKDTDQTLLRGKIVAIKIAKTRIGQQSVYSIKCGKEVYDIGADDVYKNLDHYFDIMLNYLQQEREYQKGFGNSVKLRNLHKLMRK